MTMILRFGKRIMRNRDSGWFVRQIRRMKNYNVLQAAIWKTVEYGLFNMETKMKLHLGKHPNEFKFSKNNRTEEESLNYDIVWTEIILEGTKEFEEGEYNAALQMFTKIGDYHLVKEIEKNKAKVTDPDAMKAYVPKNTKRGLVKTLYDKGYEKIKDITLNKALNDIGIIGSVELLQMKQEQPTPTVATAEPVQVE